MSLCRRSDTSEVFARPCRARAGSHARLNSLRPGTVAAKPMQFAEPIAGVQKQVTFLLVNQSNCGLGALSPHVHPGTLGHTGPGACGL